MLGAGRGSKAAPIHTRVYDAVPCDEGQDQIGFFGSQIRRAYRETTVRRISPRALSVSPYHRAIWEIRIFGFCTDTRELLLDSCPVCGKGLGWQRTHGIEYCDSCKNADRERLTDLRDFPQPVITVEDEAGLNLMCDLIHPLQDRKERARRSLSSPITDYTNSELFEFGIALCCAETMQPNRTQKVLERPKHVKHYARFTPDILSHAGRALLNWPSGLEAIAVRVRAKAADRQGFYGVAKELGPLTAIGRENILSRGLRGLLREAINRDMRETAAFLPTTRRSDYRNRSDLIMCSDASKKYHRHGSQLARLAKEGILKSLRAAGAKTGPLLLYEAEIEDLVAKAAKAENASTAAVRLGIPTGALPALAQGGMINKVVGPETRLLGSAECYDSRSIDLLIASVQAVAIHGTPPATRVRITKAVNRIGISGPKPWCSIFDAILGQRLKIWRIEGRLTAAMTSRAVEHIDRIYELIHPKRCERIPDTYGRITYREAADIIGTSESMIADLVRGKLISTSNGFQLKIERADAVRFTMEKMLTSELSRRTGIICKLVRPHLARLGVEPIARTDERCGGFVWSRSQVDSVLPKDPPC